MGQSSRHRGYAPLRCNDTTAPTGAEGVTLVSLCEYGGDVIASVTVEESWAHEFARMLELLFGDTHYAVLEEFPDGPF